MKGKGKRSAVDGLIALSEDWISASAPVTDRSRSSINTITFSLFECHQTAVSMQPGNPGGDKHSLE